MKNDLSPVASETMLILQEECAEVTQAISKCFRFGLNESYNGRTNKERLEEELGDLLAMVDILVKLTVISDNNLNNAKKQKAEKLKKWSGIFKDTVVE